MIDKQPRVMHGRNAQLAVKDSLPLDATLISMSRAGSTRPDVVAIKDGVLFQLEVKSVNTIDSVIVPLSCTVRKHSSTFIDTLVPLFTDNTHNNIHDVVEHHRLVDDSIGFPCDLGTKRSGKIPQNLIIDASHKNITTIHAHVINHLHNTGNTYLALVCKLPTPAVHVFYTGYGINVLNAPMLPQITSAKLNTYGTAPLDAMRIALRITLPLIDGLIISN